MDEVQERERVNYYASDVWIKKTRDEKVWGKSFILERIPTLPTLPTLSHTYDVVHRCFTCSEIW